MSPKKWGVDHPLLLDLPMPLVTSRLNLRPVRAGDGPLLLAARLESEAHLKAWMPWAQKVPSPEESEEYVRTQTAKYILREDLVLFGLHAQTGEFVLSAGFHRIDWKVARFEIGYWVHQKFEGQGYVTEAVRAMTEYAFQKMHAARIEIRCDGRNVRSAKIPERLGYVREAVLKDESVAVDGTLRDTWVYARTSQ